MITNLRMELFQALLITVITINYAIVKPEWNSRDHVYLIADTTLLSARPIKVGKLNKNCGVVGVWSYIHTTHSVGRLLRVTRLPCAGFPLRDSAQGECRLLPLCICIFLSTSELRDIQFRRLSLKTPGLLEQVLLEVAWLEKWGAEAGTSHSDQEKIISAVASFLGFWLVKSYDFSSHATSTRTYPTCSTSPGVLRLD